MKVRHKQVEKEAWQVDLNAEKLHPSLEYQAGNYYISLNGGELHFVEDSDWVVKEPDGFEFLMSNFEFKKHYEEVPDNDTQELRTS